jgi:hypothetical protein
MTRPAGPPGRFPERRQLNRPQALKRIRHSNYRVKKSGETGSTATFGPAIIRIQHRATSSTAPN